MVRISTPDTNAHFELIPAETRSVTISEEGITVSIAEQEDGTIEISGLEGLSQEFAELLSAACSIWKWGIVPVEA